MRSLFPILLVFCSILSEASNTYAQKPAKNINLSRKYASVLVGGSANAVPAQVSFAVLGGGLDNAVSADASSLLGGAGNRAYGRYSFLGGGGSNIVSGALATIPGGAQNQATGDASTIGGGFQNQALSPYSTVAGGNQNKTSNDGATVGGGSGNIAAALFGTIAGGLSNRATAASAFVGGGFKNEATENFAVVAGGVDNKAKDESSTVSGGFANLASGLTSTIAGGGNNNAAGTYSTIPGGGNNVASGDGSFAAGVYANAQHHFSFVWGSSESFATSSFNTNSFTVRCSGGARFYSANGDSAGVGLAPGSGTWTSLSDRNAKENFRDVNASDVLAKVAAMPIKTWNYKTQKDSIRHIGPTAQDFKVAFGVGESDTGITTVDADGVLFLSVKGLVEELKDRDAKIGELEAKMEAMEERLNSLPPAR